MSDHSFKKGKYTVSLVSTLIFFSIVVVSYVDSITCPMILQLATEGSLASSLRQGEGERSAAATHQPNDAMGSEGGLLGGLDSKKPTTGIHISTKEPKETREGGGKAPVALKGTTLMSRFLRLPRSVFDEAYTYFPCNVQDLLLQIYMVWFIVFMLHKWVIYKKEGWHYFMLDYCYFHNFIMIFMLLSATISVDVHSFGGAVRNHRYAPYYRQPSAGATTAVADDEGFGVAPPVSGGSKSGVSGGPSGIPLRSSPPEAFLEGALPTFWEVMVGIVYDGAESAATLDMLRYYAGDPLRALAPPVASTLVGWWDVLSADEAKGMSRKTASRSRAVDVAFAVDEALAPFSSAPTEFAYVRAETTTEDRIAATTRLDAYVPTIKIRIAPARYALGSMPPLSQIRFVVVFIMFLGGTFGPILGAIVVWNNALLFHSFDKMTACYLHLAPALVQIVIMSAVYETADMVKHLQGIFEAATEGLSAAEMPRMPSVMMQHQPIGVGGGSSIGGASSSFPTYFTPIDTKSIFSHYLTIPNLLASHVAFFLLWQLFYHVTFGLMAVRRERKFAKKMRRENKDLRTFADCGTNPTARVTAYTWMMEHPPGGKNGLRYRIVFALGDSEHATKFMFSVVQLAFHLVYIFASVPALYVALKWREEPSWLLPYLCIFLIVAISNAATVMAKWIGKLQLSAAAAETPSASVSEGVSNENAGAKKAIAAAEGKKAQSPKSSQKKGK